MKPLVTDSSFSLEKSPFPGHFHLSSLVFILALSLTQLQNLPCLSYLSQSIVPLEAVTVFYTPYGAWHVVSTELILSGLECFKGKGSEEVVVLYLLLKVVFILCRFHVDKLSSAHVYLRLHKVTGFKHGLMTFSLAMSILSCPLSFFCSLNCFK